MGKFTHGAMQDNLTNSVFHSWGIKLRLTDRQAGRVANIVNSAG
ncbi:MAG: hypothetical protein COT71_03525 [Candidatus Andersenbacteria bacterium CG10_big_fil_rev_8_21_14_0_10_54_11]|uniref:Uncharacterized protein n=1 Tax=Candidatus Andersenbacteria bacterium CG10_big_fil_rev_8_21_14_0_10_54_11 TaxID=1974485 RepID=A0A2M6WYP9_9BACT|nr:MAG: hypothetical protein COT71_03525 [Candidatus Andersenbacteria bacterium CG10_big_fil_rev_8_21_14_0_10_54_11]